MREALRRLLLYYLLYLFSSYSTPLGVLNASSDLFSGSTRELVHVEWSQGGANINPSPWLFTCFVKKPCTL